MHQSQIFDPFEYNQGSEDFNSNTETSRFDFYNSKGRGSVRSSTNQLKDLTDSRKKSLTFMNNNHQSQINLR